eukprot:g3640.t1
MSAANTVVENGGRVVLLDKSSFCGGNSTKATSGINGAGWVGKECMYVFGLLSSARFAGTKTQKAKGIPDNADIFTQELHDCEHNDPRLDTIFHSKHFASGHAQRRRQEA